MATQLHLAKNTFALHLLFKRLERLIDIVVTNDNLHLVACSISPNCYKVGTAKGITHPGSGGRYIMIARLLQTLSDSFAPELPLAILKIARMGHPVLLGQAEPVTDPAHPEIQRLIDDMIETMMDAGGVGLAAPQVHVPLRLFVFHLPASRVGGEDGEAPGEALPAQAVINPGILPKGEVLRLGWEGCLSIPGLRAAVPRFAQITYTGLDRNGIAMRRDADGLHAVVVQHETDHLDGILYPMRMTDHSLMGFNEELARFQPVLPNAGEG
jgi:peptide deformylase